MKVLKILSIMLIPLISASCANNELSEQEMSLVEAQMEQNTLEISCPSGCEISYRDPRDRITLPDDTNAWDAVISVWKSAERIALGGAPYYMGIEAIRALSDTGDTRITTTTTTRNTDNSTGDYSGESSGNTGEQYTDTSGRIGSDDDYTHEPTVVDQPDPTIVEQPEPIIVDQSGPPAD